MEYLNLNNGTKILAAGIGTFLMQPEEAEAACIAALKKGYVLIDTANAQIILRWHTQVGNIVIPGSKNEAHIKDNIGIFDITLTDEEMEKITAVDKNVRYYTATKEALQGYLAFAPDFDEQK